MGRLTPEPETMRAALLGAADLVDRGWCQGTYALDDRDKRVETCSPHAVAWCAEGALARAVFDMGIMDDAEFLVEKLVDAVEIRSGIHITAWNDAKRRTSDDVSSRMREAAGRIRA